MCIGPILLKFFNIFLIQGIFGRYFCLTNYETSFFFFAKQFVIMYILLVKVSTFSKTLKSSNHLFMVDLLLIDIYIKHKWVVNRKFMNTEAPLMG